MVKESASMISINCDQVLSNSGARQLERLPNRNAPSSGLRRAMLRPCRSHLVNAHIQSIIHQTCSNGAPGGEVEESMGVVGSTNDVLQRNSIFCIDGVGGRRVTSAPQKNSRNILLDAIKRPGTLLFDAIRCYIRNTSNLFKRI